MEMIKYTLEVGIPAVNTHTRPKGEKDIDCNISADWVASEARNKDARYTVTLERKED